MANNQTPSLRNESIETSDVADTTSTSEPSSTIDANENQSPMQTCGSASDGIDKLMESEDPSNGVQGFKQRLVTNYISRSQESKGIECSGMTAGSNKSLESNLSGKRCEAKTTTVKKKDKPKNPWKNQDITGNAGPFCIKVKQGPFRVKGLPSRDYSESFNYHEDPLWRPDHNHICPYSYEVDAEFQMNQHASQAEIQYFQTLGLNKEQISGLANLGFNVGKLMPRSNLTYPADPRIPPSFELSGASCWWCECAHHVSWGVSLLLKDDPFVVGFDLKWKTNASSKGFNKVALIQVATSDTVLLVPTKAGDHSAPRALHILFRNPEIIKVGVGVMENLLKLWRDYQIETNSYAELNELMLHSKFDFGIIAEQVNRFELQTFAYLMGYPKWKNTKLSFSNWESRPLIMEHLHCATMDALMSVRVFWGMLTGRKMSKPISSIHLKLKVKSFVRPVFKTMAISLLDKEQRIERLKREGLTSDNIWESSLFSAKNSGTLYPFDYRERSNRCASSQRSPDMLDMGSTPKGLGLCVGALNVFKGEVEIKPRLKDLCDDSPRLPPLKIKHDSDEIYHKPLELRTSPSDIASVQCTEYVLPPMHDWSPGRFSDAGIWSVLGSTM